MSGRRRADIAARDGVTSTSPCGVPCGPTVAERKPRGVTARRGAHGRPRSAAARQQEAAAAVSAGTGSGAPQVSTTLPLWLLEDERLTTTTILSSRRGAPGPGWRTWRGSSPTRTGIAAGASCCTHTAEQGHGTTGTHCPTPPVPHHTPHTGRAGRGVAASWRRYGVAGMSGGGSWGRKNRLRRPLVGGCCWWVLLVTVTLGLLPVSMAARKQSSTMGGRGQQHQPTVCKTYNDSSGAVSVNASSLSLVNPKVTSECFLFRAPSDHYTLALNFTQLYGFWVQQGGTGGPVGQSGGTGGAESSSSTSPVSDHGLKNGPMGGTGSERTGTGNGCLPCLTIAAPPGEDPGGGGDGGDLGGGHRGRDKGQEEDGQVQEQDLEEDEEEQSICSCDGRRALPYLLRRQASVVKLTFKWLPSQDSGLRLVYSFQKTDESTSGAEERNGHDNHKYSNIMQVIAAVVAVALFVFFFIFCVILAQRHRARRPRDDRLHLPGDCEHGRLHAHHHSPLHTEVVYRPDGNRHLCDPDMNRSLDQRTQVRVQPLHSKEEVANYPPHIQRTLDGEEGYSECQRYLQSTTWDPTACRPPPNRTIYDGESPPPYRPHSPPHRSQSVSHIGRTGQNTKAAAARSGNNSLFSMSSNNNNTRNSNLNDAPLRHHHHHHQQQHQPHTAAGGAALPGSYPHHNLTVYGHPPRTCLGPLHLPQQQLSLQEQSQLHHLQQQQQHAQQQHSLAGIASHPTTNRRGGGHPEAIAPTPALGPPPNYSDVVNATNLFTTSPPDSDV